MRRTIEKARVEIVAGRLWRAKEILQGAVPNAGYDCALFEELGRVLLQMGDLPAAGRFLFLAGARRRDYEDAINIFLGKYRNNPRALYAAFPRPARLVARLDYPVALQVELKELGFPELLRAQALETSSAEDSWIPAMIGWTVAGSLLVLLLLGVIKVIEIWQWLKAR